MSNKNDKVASDFLDNVIDSAKKLNLNCFIVVNNEFKITSDKELTLSEAEKEYHSWMIGIECKYTFKDLLEYFRHLVYSKDNHSHCLTRKNVYPRWIIKCIDIESDWSIFSICKQENISDVLFEYATFKFEIYLNKETFEKEIGSLTYTERQIDKSNIFHNKIGINNKIFESNSMADRELISLIIKELDEFNSY